MTTLQDLLDLPAGAAPGGEIPMWVDRSKAISVAISPVRPA